MILVICGHWPIRQELSRKDHSIGRWKVWFPPPISSANELEETSRTQHEPRQWRRIFAYWIQLEIESETRTSGRAVETAALYRKARLRDDENDGDDGDDSNDNGEDGDDSDGDANENDDYDVNNDNDDDDDGLIERPRYKEPSNLF